MFSNNFWTRQPIVLKTIEFSSCLEMDANSIWLDFQKQNDDLFQPYSQKTDFSIEFKQAYICLLGFSTHLIYPLFFQSFFFNSWNMQKPIISLLFAEFN